MTIAVEKLQPSFKPFDFEENVRAKRLDNSPGSEQNRIHMLGYSGIKGEDPYAVAAARMDFGSRSEAQLGWLDRKFFILHQEDRVWYKINISSLQKRLNPKIALNVDEDTGICCNLKEVISSSDAKPIRVNCFKEMKVDQYRQTLVPYGEKGEPVEVKSPALKELLDYCKNHENDLFKGLESLGLAFVDQFEVTIFSAYEDHQPEIKIRFPYNCLNPKGKINRLHYQVISQNKFVESEKVECRFAFDDVDSKCSLEKNFEILLDSLLKRFQVWLNAAKKVVEMSEEKLFENLLLNSKSWKEFELKDQYKPNFDKSRFDLKLGLEGLNLIWNLKLGSEACTILTNKESSNLPFDDFFDVWKQNFENQLKEFLDVAIREAQDLNYWAHAPLGASPSIQEPVSFDQFKTLEDLLGLKEEELQKLHQEEKYTELKELLKKKRDAALLTCHPDKGISPDAEKTRMIIELSKKAIDYVEGFLI